LNYLARFLSELKVMSLSILFGILGIRTGIGK
jgi:hypothetical protein